MDNYGVVVAGPSGVSAWLIYMEGRRRQHSFVDPDFGRTADRVPFRWYGFNDDLHTPGHGDLRVVVALGSADSFSNVDPDDPTAYNFFCDYDAQTPEEATFDCDKNNSTISATNLEMPIESSMDPNGDGWVDLNRYADRFGQGVNGCAGSDLDCIPMILEHIPVTERSVPSGTVYGSARCQCESAKHWARCEPDQTGTNSTCCASYARLRQRQPK